MSKVLVKYAIFNAPYTASRKVCCIDWTRCISSHEPWAGPPTCCNHQCSNFEGNHAGVWSSSSSSFSVLFASTRRCRACAQRCAALTHPLDLDLSHTKPSHCCTSVQRFYLFFAPQTTPPPHTISRPLWIWHATSEPQLHLDSIYGVRYELLKSPGDFLLFFSYPSLFIKLKWTEKL